MLKKIISYSKSLDYIPAFSFSQRRRGLKYRYRRKFDKDEPCYYTPLQEQKPKIDEYISVEGSKERKFNRYSLSPHQYWITHGKGTERPFTGEHWDRKDVGHYECIVCSNKLFSQRSDHKYQTPTGMASFWTSIQKSVELLDDVADIKEDKTNITSKLIDEGHKKQRCVCSKCKSHLGTLHFDGPPPLFVRYSINSGALNFIEKPWFHPPQYYRLLKKQEREKAQQAKEHAKNDIVDKLEIAPAKFAEIEKSAKLPKQQ